MVKIGGSYKIEGVDNSKIYIVVGIDSERVYIKFNDFKTWFGIHDFTENFYNCEIELRREKLLKLKEKLKTSHV